MELTLNEDIATLPTDELVVYVRLFFLIDKRGYVQGKLKDLSKAVDMSVPRLRKALGGLFEKQKISMGNDKIYFWNFEKKTRDILEKEISYSQGEKTIPIEQKPNDDETLLMAIGDYYNKLVSNKGMPQIKALTPKRKAFVRCRMKEYGKDAVYKVIENAANSAFLNGNGERSFLADFEWIMRPNNFIKVLEGKYNNERKRTTTSAEQQYFQGAANLLQRLDAEREK